MNSSIPNLNPEQKKAATAPISPLLIVAGAGTGKTRTLTSRIVHLISSGIRPDRICAITFTNKAAQEMKERIATMTGSGEGPYIGTFHSLGARILRKECRVFGRSPNFAIFDDHDSFDLVKKAVKSILTPASELDKIDKKKRKDTPAFFAQKIGELKNLERGRVEEKMDERKKDELGRIFDIYEASLQRNNAFDFDDLIQKPVLAFRTHPEILKNYRNKFDAILVDEYQDINPKQYELVRLLAGEHRNLTVVGDDEQTIYTWRYADIKIFLDFEKDWPGATVHFLEENYRSTGNIINGASSMVQNNKFRAPKKLWTKADDGAPITLYEAWGENDEAAWIAMQIANIKTKNGKNAPQSEDTSENVAILYRTNAQSRAIEQALIRENIPYKIFGGLKFYERREVKDAVAALRYASNTHDELSKERLEKNLTKKKFAEFKATIAKLENPKPTDIIKIFLETFGYFDYLEENFINADERQENIAELITFASGFESLPELLERLSLLQSTDDSQAEKSKTSEGPKRANKNVVHLSTIHLAKGLEFDNVFVAGAAEGLLPHIRSIDNDSAVEEERRLMYVAMTRAKKNLRISFYGIPSRFIGEIPEGHTRFHSESDSDQNSKRNWKDLESDDAYDSDYERYVEY